MRVFGWEEHRKISGENFCISLQKEDSVKRASLHGHQDLCEWVCVISGTMLHNANGVEVSDDRGTVTLIRPNDIHMMSGRKFTIVNVVFPLHWFSSFDSLWGTPHLCEGLLECPSPPKVKIPKEEFGKIEELLLKTISFGRGTFARQHFTVFFSTMLTSYFNVFLKDSRESFKSAPLWFLDTMDWLNRNADKNITLGELRKKAGRCPEHISREFVKHLGCGPNEYILRLRLQKAANLLVVSNFPITEICFMAGFSNLSHFCRKFRELFKMSPRDYRETSGSHKLQF